MSGNTPEWETRIRNALGDTTGDDAPLTAAIGIEIVRAIRETTEVPVPEEIIEALIPVSITELERLADRNPAQSDLFEALIAVRKATP